MATITPSVTTDVPVIDVYFFNYRDILTMPSKDRNPLTKAFFLILTFLSTGFTFMQAFNPFRKTSGISRKDIFQIFCGLAVLAIIFAAATIAIIALSAAISEAIKLDLDHIPLAANYAKNAFAAILPILAAIGVSSTSLASSVAVVSEKVVAMMNYMSAGHRKGAIVGPFEDLVCHVSGGDYKAIHILAYSFGSVVTLDTLFPKGGERTGRHFQAITSLVTIGCPFDVIRFYYPSYFAGRYPVIGASTRWLNVFSPADVLGSNFRDDEEDLPAEIHIGQASSARKPENFSYVDAVSPDKFTFLTSFLLLGLRAHGMYWEKTPCSELSCFRLIIEALLRKAEPSVGCPD
ncbi:MAG: hypothetical protein HY888_04110 [Deltaproteobacteria bacterium]|nr:hypothetical protein [Deltaproteobacteria bacterium]